MKNYEKEIGFFLISLGCCIFVGITTTWYIGLFFGMLIYSFPIRLK